VIANGEVFVDIAAVKAGESGTVVSGGFTVPLVSVARVIFLQLYPEVMEETRLNVHNLGLGVLVGDDILLALSLLLAVLPHPQEVLVHTPAILNDSAPVYENLARVSP